MLRQWTASLVILVEDLPLDPTLNGLLVRGVVENSMNLPDMFELTFNDPAREVIALGGFAIGAMVSLAVDGGSEGPSPLMVGEVTAVELEYDVEGSKTIIRGLDMSNRLFRGKKTRTFQDMLASEIVEEILGENEVVPGDVDPTDDPILYMVQAGTTDWQFIQKLAHDCGYRAWMMDGFFNFAPTTPPVSGDVPGTIEVNDPLQLVLGQGLLRLRAVVRSTEQVDDVQVAGWSPDDGEPVVGVSPSDSLGVELEVQPAELAALSGANSFQHLWYPTDDEDAAETKAAAIGNQLAEAYAELEGESVGNSALRAGVPVNLSLAGPPFDGGYTLTTARHVFDPNAGYTTQFTVSGWQDRSMLSLASGPEPVSPEPFRIPGVVSATVMDTRDPEEQGRVQLMFTWMGPEVISDWVRCVQQGVSEASGTLFVPNPGTEVLVAFEQGDPSKPYVIGGLFSPVMEPGASPDLIDEATGLVNEQRLKSRTLHNLTFYDGEEVNGIMLQVGDETQTLFMDAEEDMITLSITEGAIMIQGGADVTINAGGDLMLNSEGSVLINGAAVTVTADEALTVAGGSVAIAGDEDLSIDAPVVAING